MFNRLILIAITVLMAHSGSHASDSVDQHEKKETEKVLFEIEEYLKLIVQKREIMEQQMSNVSEQIQLMEETLKLYGELKEILSTDF